VPRTKRDIEKQKTFARSLNTLMDLHHIKDAATLSRLAGMDSSSISRYLRGKAIPNSGGMLALARVFNVTVEELMTGATKPPTPSQESLQSRVDDLSTRLQEAVKWARQNLDDTTKRITSIKVQQNQNVAVFMVGAYATLEALKAVATGAEEAEAVEKLEQTLLKLRDRPSGPIH